MEKLLSNDAKGVGTMAIALFAAIVIIAAGAGIYILTKNNDSDEPDDEDNALMEYYSVDIDEPNILGSMGIGTMMMYNLVSGEVNGMPISKDPVMVGLLGQSGSYYFYIINSNNTSFSPIPFMLEKTTGELRGGELTGTDSIQYNGKNIPLNVYKNSLPETSITVSAANGIPYKITVEIDKVVSSNRSDKGNFTVSLASISATPATPYVMSERFGESYYYSFKNQDGRSGVVSLCAVGNITSPAGEDQLILIMYFNVEDKNGVKTEACTYGHTGLKDTVKLLESDNKSGEETISTIDGDVLCDVVEFVGDKMYVGKDTGIAYQYEYSSFFKIVHGDLKLFKYVN